MVLIERKEALDSLMKEVLSFIDYQSYKPLYVFIIGDRSLERFINRIVSSQRLIRRFLAKKHFNTVKIESSCSCASILNHSTLLFSGIIQVLRHRFESIYLQYGEIIGCISVLISPSPLFHYSPFQ